MTRKWRLGALWTSLRLACLRPMARRLLSIAADPPRKCRPGPQSWRLALCARQSARRPLKRRSRGARRSRLKTRNEPRGCDREAAKSRFASHPRLRHRSPEPVWRRVGGHAQGAGDRVCRPQLTGKRRSNQKKLAFSKPLLYFTINKGRYLLFKISRPPMFANCIEVAHVRFLVFFVPRAA